MREAFIHFLRYVGWALAGATFGLGLFLLWCERGPSYITPAPEALVFVAALSSLSLVLIRAGVGILGGVESNRMDRFTAVGVRRFGIGGAAGWLAADYVRSFAPMMLFLRLNDDGWWLLPLVLAGACAGVATGWLAWRRHGRVLLPVAWTLVFVLLVTGWLALAQELMHQRVRLSF